MKGINKKLRTSFRNKDPVMTGKIRNKKHDNITVTIIKK